MPTTPTAQAEAKYYCVDELVVGTEQSLGKLGVEVGAVVLVVVVELVLVLVELVVMVQLLWSWWWIWFC